MRVKDGDGMRVVLMRMVRMRMEEVYPWGPPRLSDVCKPLECGT